MKIEQFTELTLAYWRAYFTRLARAVKNGEIDTGGKTILYPCILLVTSCNGIFVAELLGASVKYVGLSLKKSKEPSIYKLLSQFDDSSNAAIFRCDAACNGFYGVCFARSVDVESVKKRFPNIALYPSGIVIPEGEGSLIEFGKNFRSCSFERCVLINKKGDLFRVKSILSMFIVSSSISLSELKFFYNNFADADEIRSIYVEESDGCLSVAGQLQNLCLSSGVHETTIGEFIRLHPDIILRAFSCDSFLYEKSFPWIKSNYPMEEKEINPDLLLRRKDGFYDICDLKTVAFKCKSLTRGRTARKRFVDYVHEGIAQLVNYREYFSIPENAEFAFEKFGVKVSDPKLILVVGSWENAVVEDVAKASMNHSGVTIIDYDTFCHLYISGSLT
ncbi:hypothetical protein [Pseudomonas fluorescens]|uniref:hypothetical protein n=1 Tax=Pseudomonas fluorescens TaxID=294 RepID=UPI00192B1B61|nr:hypothetical protein [Pseudomonas fluorescens]MBL4981690.1 hypothetical protein [Pseudomonas fluorescens]